MKKPGKMPDSADRKRLESDAAGRSMGSSWTIQKRVRLPHKIGQPLGSTSSGDGSS